jgi:hypothetical protein
VNAQTTEIRTELLIVKQKKEIGATKNPQEHTVAKGSPGKVPSVGIRKSLHMSNCSLRIVTNHSHHMGSKRFPTI